MLETFSPVCAFQFQRLIGEGKMESTATATITKIGDEYFLTKGHYHTRREAAEIYIGLKGEGAMLLEDEDTLESRMVSLKAGEIVYVPGNTAHRTVNTGGEPLVYLGVYPWNAGHDYGAIAERNFLRVIVERDGRPTLTDRHP